MKNLTLAKTAGFDFPESLRQYLRKRIDAARNAIGEAQKHHIATLEGFERYLATLDMEDQRIYALSLIAVATHGNDRNFEPGELTNQLLSFLGGRGAAPSPDDTLNELVATGLRDLLDSRAKLNQELREKLRLAEEELGRIQPDADRLTELERAHEGVRADRDAMEAERDQAIADREYLREHLGGDVEPNGKPKDATPRRIGLPGVPGIYVTKTAEGAVYEIGFADDGGKKRWKKVGTDIDEAKALREELHGKPYKKEAVAA